MAWRGIDIREAGEQIVIRSLLQDADGAIITSGDVALYLYEFQTDGTLKSFDFADSTFKSTTVTTETQLLTHRKGNNGATDTGVYTYVVSTVTGFTEGGIYLSRVTHADASDQLREFQYGDDIYEVQDSVDDVQATVDDVETAVGEIDTSVAEGKIDAVQATVDDVETKVDGIVAGDGGDDSATLLAIKAKTDLISTGNVTVTSTVSADGETITIVRGDDYVEDIDNRITFTSSDWIDLTGASVTMSVRKKKNKALELTVVGEVVDAGEAEQTVVFQPTADQTTTMTPGYLVCKFDVEATTAGDLVKTLVLGECTVLEDQTR